MIRATVTLLLVASIVRAEDIDCLKPPSNIGTSCCKIPDEINTLGRTSNETMEIASACRAANYPATADVPLEEQLRAGECYVECAMNATGMLTVDKKLNATAFTSLVPETSPWKDQLQKSLTTCIDKIGPLVKETSRCKSGSQGIIICLGRELFLNCPDVAWNNSPECIEMKKYIEKCKEITE